MVVEIALIALGVFTTLLGIWNIFIEAYIWGIIFLIAGLWSIWLGVMYILQLKKASKRGIQLIDSSSEAIPFQPDSSIANADLFKEDDNINKEVQKALNINTKPQEEDTEVVILNEKVDMLTSPKNLIIKNEESKNKNK